MNLEGIVSKRIGSGYVQRPDAGMAEDEPKTIGQNGRSRRRGVGDIACFSFGASADPFTRVAEGGFPPLLRRKQDGIARSCHGRTECSPRG